MTDLHANPSSLEPVAVVAVVAVVAAVAVVVVLGGVSRWGHYCCAC